jgi:O-6-methylguanine DNA methyltransferase
MPYYADLLETRIGYVHMVVNEDGELAWLYVSPINAPEMGDTIMTKNFGNLEWNKRKCAHVVKQTTEYFQKKRKKFDLKLELKTTPFRHKVWSELMKIPYGLTVTYADIAKRIGQPQAMRAVGQANHNNPIMIVIPCHRVVTAGRKVTGPDKNCHIRELLLELEGASFKQS